MKKIIFFILICSIPPGLSANAFLLLNNIQTLPQENITYKSGDREYFSPQKISLLVNNQKLFLGDAFIEINRWIDSVSQIPIPESWSILYNSLGKEAFENSQKYNGIRFYPGNTWCENEKMKYDWDNKTRTCQNNQNIITLQGTKIYNTIYVSEDDQEKIFHIFPIEPIGVPFTTEISELPSYTLIDDTHVSQDLPSLEFTKKREDILLSIWGPNWGKKYRVYEYKGSRVVYPYYEGKLSIPAGTYQLTLYFPFSPPSHIDTEEIGYNFSF